MSKIKMSRADVLRCWPRVWSLGYCEMSEALRLLDGPRGYACGVYGWNYDVYDVGGVAVCTGYRDMPGADVPRWFVRKWEKRARRVSSIGFVKCGEYERARARFVRAFGAAFGALRVSRAEYKCGRCPVVPDWARRVLVKRGGAWFYEDGRDVKGARLLVRPAYDERYDGRPGFDFVLGGDGRHVERRYNLDCVNGGAGYEKIGAGAACPVCASLADRLKVCAAGAGCFYYLGRGNIGAASGRPLCGNVGGRYESGAAARYVSELTVCPCGKWRGAADVNG